MKQRKGWRMSCDVGKAREGLENELWRRWSDGKLWEWAHSLTSPGEPLMGKIPLKAVRVVNLTYGELILQAFCHFTYVTAHSPTLPSLYLHHSSFSNSSVASPTSQLILQSFFLFPYVTGFSLTSPGEPPITSTLPKRVWHYLPATAPIHMLWPWILIHVVALTNT